MWNKNHRLFQWQSALAQHRWLAQCRVCIDDRWQSRRTWRCTRSRCRRCVAAPQCWQRRRRTHRHRSASRWRPRRRLDRRLRMSGVESSSHWTDSFRAKTMPESLLHRHGFVSNAPTPNKRKTIFNVEKHNENCYCDFLSYNDFNFDLILFVVNIVVGVDDVTKVERNHAIVSAADGRRCAHRHASQLCANARDLRRHKRRRWHLQVGAQHWKRTLCQCNHFSIRERFTHSNLHQFKHQTKFNNQKRNKKHQQ